MKARFLLLLFFVASFGFLFKTSVFAQTTNYPLKTNADVPRDFHTYSQGVLIEILSALSCQAAGIDPINPKNKCLGVDIKTGKIGYVEGNHGLIGIMGDMIGMTFKVPVSSGQYFSDLANNFGVAKKSYAKTLDGSEDRGTTSRPDPNASIGTGIGFDGLAPILELWKVFRNVVYLFFVFVFVVIGLGIMFRIKIDPRTVMTIQNQIPKIIIALVLVTFSYAIAGFLIDMMYVMLYLIYNLFTTPTLHVDVSGLNPNTIQGANPISTVGFLGGAGIAKDASVGIGSVIANLFNIGIYGRIIGALGGMLFGAVAGIIVPGVGNVVGGIVGGVAGGLFGFGVDKMLGIVGGIVAFFIIIAAMLTALFRLWFQLIKAYIFILINTVIAPFWIAGGLIPGSTRNFGMWMRDMVGNLSAFPATLFMFLIGRIFIEKFGTKGTGGQFTPPFVGNPGDHDNFGALIGLGIILLTPQVVTMVRAAIKAPEGKYSSAVGATLKMGTGMNQQLFTPMGRGLMGRKNPFTGKREGGVIRNTAKLAAQNFYRSRTQPQPGATPGPVGRGLRAVGSRVNWLRERARTPEQTAQAERQRQEAERRQRVEQARAQNQRAQEANEAAQLGQPVPPEETRT